MIKRLLLLMSLTILSIQAFALEPVYSSWGKAIKGYDTVAYFTEGKPVKGDKKFTYEWNDAKWFFASQQNVDLFKADPEKYAPQYGGYCAYAVSRNYTAKIDPKAWTIDNGKLYLNYSKGILDKWDADRAANIVAGDNNWPSLIKK